MKPINNPYYTEEEAVARVGPGWEHLVRRVYNAIAGLGLNTGIINVKEKFGGLRIYPDYWQDDLEKVIIEVETESFTVCEKCGKDGGLRNMGGIYQTACEEHAKGYPEISPF